MDIGIVVFILVFVVPPFIYELREADKMYRQARRNRHS